MAAMKQLLEAIREAGEDAEAVWLVRLPSDGHEDPEPLPPAHTLFPR